MAELDSNLIEIETLNGLIAEEEKKIDGQYLQAGKAYYEIHGTDAEEGMKVFVHNIKDSLDKVEEYRNQIYKIRGIQICPNCNSEIPVSFLFCNVCGLRMPENGEKKVLPENLIRCAGCGTVLRKDQKFCFECGRPVNQPEEKKTAEPAAYTTREEEKAPEVFAAQNIPPVTEPSYIPEPPVPPVKAQPEARICPNCGKPASAKALFCTGCGTPLGR